MEKLLPQNIEAECGVLGSIIIDPEAIIQVADFLHPEDFYRDAHRMIYEVILQLNEQHAPADYITICDVLAGNNKLDIVGGAGYVTSLINQVPTSGNVEYYGRIVARTALLRRLIHAAGQIAAVAYEESDADAALDQAEKLIFDISQGHSNTDFSPIRDLLAAYMTRLDALHDGRGAIVGVPTGFADLDRLTGGLQRSDLIILAARPAVGKCLPAWTLIDNPETGERLTIKDCVKRQMPTVYGISEGGHIRPTKISEWIDSGIKPCFRISTRLGRIVEVTGQHPFLTVQGWTPLSDLIVGDHIAVPTKVECFGSDESWPLEIVRLLAYSIAKNGPPDESPVFSNTDPLIVESFQQIMGKPARKKSFPTCVWQWSKPYLAEFLCVLMSSDGWIYSTHGRSYLEFIVVSEKLAFDLQHAFTRFGILTSCRQLVSSFQGKKLASWRLSIDHPESLQIYQEEIGWLGEKALRFVADSHKSGGRGGIYEHTANDPWLIIRADATNPRLSLPPLAYKSGNAMKQGKFISEHVYTENSITAFADIIDNPLLRRIASPDIYWDTIAAIEAIGEHQVYDLSVPDGANFIAQDIFVHNTSFALSLAHNAAIKHQQSVAIFSLEMSKEQLVQRLLSMDASIDQQRLRTGWIEDAEWERIINSMSNLSQANIWIEDTAGISSVEMRSKARRLQAEHGIDMIIVDYLQLMQSTAGGKRNENRVQEISEISRNLKGLARELNIPVMALAQLSRAVESRTSKVPQLSDLRESGCLTGESLIYLPETGEYHRIDTLVGHQDFSVLALNKQTWKLEPRNVSQAFSTGRKPVFKLTTHQGHTIRATGNHKFLSSNDWQRLDELTIGTTLAVPRTLPTLQEATLTLDASARLTSGDVYWDEVVSIVSDGVEDVYDLTVEEHHNFVANNIVVHNSIEQDADIVMFIYRDEVYNPETERKNIADIIIAKHRNGPVGEVSLYFQPSQTRFSDLEPTHKSEEEDE